MGGSVSGCTVSCGGRLGCGSRGTYPTEPYQGCAQAHLAGGEETLNVRANFAKRELALAVRRHRTPSTSDIAQAARLHRLDRE